MAVMFDGTDKIQHQAWQFVDPNLIPAERSEFYNRMRGVCREYFANVDRYIEKLVTLAGPDCQVFFASDHGFTATVEVLRINSFLEDLGYLKWAANDGSEQALRREASDFANLDWSQTTAYCRTPSSNGIHIRVASKPGEPGIKPEDYVPFRDKLIEDLKTLRNEDGGLIPSPFLRSLVPLMFIYFVTIGLVYGITTGKITRSVDVLKREDWFPGQHMERACDLTLVLRDNGFVSIRNLKPAVVKRPNPAGTHHPDGIFMAYGKGIAANGLVDRLDIRDVCPTLLHSLGLPTPSDFEGKVAEPFFSSNWLAEHPVKIGKPTMKDGERAKAEDMDDEEKKQIIEQLQMLGYME